MRIILESIGELACVAAGNKEKMKIVCGPGIIHIDKKKGSFLFNGVPVKETIEIPKLIGHRGLGKGKDKKENRIEGIKKCMQFCSMAEIDVQVTKDRKVVIYHDQQIDERNIDEVMYKEIENRVDLLSDLLQQTEIGLNIEIKYENQKNFSVSEWCSEILSVVSNSNSNSKLNSPTERKIIYSSFNRSICEELQEKNNSVLLLLEELTEESVKYAIKRKYIGIVTEAAQIECNLDLVRMIKRSLAYLLTYGDKNSSLTEISMQKGIGVDGFISDEVELLSKFTQV